MTYYTAAELAKGFRVQPKTIRKEALELGLGIDFAGSSGYRSSDQDRQNLINSMRTPEPVAADGVSVGFDLDRRPRTCKLPTTTVTECAQQVHNKPLARLPTLRT